MTISLHAQKDYTGQVFAQSDIQLNFWEEKNYYDELILMHSDLINKNVKQHKPDVVERRSLKYME